MNIAVSLTGRFCQGCGDLVGAELSSNLIAEPRFANYAEIPTLLSFILNWFPAASIPSVLSL